MEGINIRCFPKLATFDHRHSIVYPCLAENALKMVLDRTFRKIEPGGDFLVR
jgi:hypothetical protein